MHVSLKPKRLLLPIALGILTLFLISLASCADASATDNWTLAGSGDFDVASNWSSGVPSVNTDTVNSTRYYITHSQNIADTVNSFLTDSNFILSGGSLTVNNGLNVYGSEFIVMGGALNAPNISLYGKLYGQDSDGQLDFESTTSSPSYTLDNSTITSDPVTGTSSAAGLITLNDGAVSPPPSATLTLGSHLKVIGKNMTIAARGGTLINNTSLISSEGGNWTYEDGTFTNSASATVEATGANSYAVFFADTIDNHGLIESQNGGTVVMIPNSYTNLGTIIANGAGSAVNIGGGEVSLGNGNSLSATNGGQINLQTILNNTNSTLDVASIAATGLFNLNGGTILNGTITHSEDLGFTGTGGTLDGVTLTPGATLNVNSGSAYISHNFNYSGTPTFNLSGGNLVINSSANINGTNPSNAGATTLDNAILTADNANGVFGNQPGTLTSGNGETLTLGSGLNVSGSIFYFNGNNFINNDTLNSAYGGDWFITSSLFTNETGAAIEATGINNKFIIAPTTLDNLGTIQAVNGAAVFLQPKSYSSIGTVKSVGIGSTGSSGSNVQLAGGTVTMGNGDSLTASNGGTINDLVSTTEGKGAVITIGSGSSLTINSQPLQVTGGTLNGNGTVNGDVNNTGGTVMPGDAPGTLTIGKSTGSGNYTQGTGGTLLEEIGGNSNAGATPQFSVLNVTGAANLAGTLDVSLYGGFTPIVGDSFGFLTYGSLSNQNMTVNSLNPGYSYSIFDNTGAKTLFLNVTGTASPAPEPSGLNIVLLVFGSLGALILRRKRYSHRGETLTISRRGMIKHEQSILLYPPPGRTLRCRRADQSHHGLSGV